jgi:hypothetical protein
MAALLATASDVSLWLWVMGVIFVLAQLVIGAGIGVLVSSHRSLCAQVAELEKALLRVELRAEVIVEMRLTIQQCLSEISACRTKIRNIEEECRSRMPYLRKEGD